MDARRILHPDQTMPPDVFAEFKALGRRLSQDPAYRTLVQGEQRKQIRRIRPLLPTPAAPALRGPYLEGFSGPVWRLSDLYIIASLQADPTGRDWYHVSYKQEGSDTPPCHDCTEAVRSAMFRSDALVLAIYPPQEEYVSHTAGVLHLWQRLGDDRLVPDLRVRLAAGSTL